MFLRNWCGLGLLTVKPRRHSAARAAKRFSQEATFSSPKPFAVVRQTDQDRRMMQQIGKNMHFSEADSKHYHQEIFAMVNNLYSISQAHALEKYF